jgi:NAD(P)-dependent dehydrogenase (short-subunit alcohol dehydrogenase family)
MKTALITGAASGLGQAVAERLARDGWQLVLWDRNDEGLRETASRCGSASVTNQVVNLAEEASVNGAFSALDAASRIPDFIFHAAGVLDVGDLDTLTAAACRRDVEVNYLGTVHLLLAASARLQKGARIVCVSSIAGLKGLPEFAGYCASKFAVYGFCEAVHGDFKRRGVALSVICPPAVDTPMVRNLPSRPVLYDIFPFAEKERVVDSIIKAIEKRDSFLILVDAQSAFLHRFNGLMPRVTSAVLEGLVQRKRRRTS